MKREMPPVSAPAGPISDAAVRAALKLPIKAFPKVISTTNAKKNPNKKAEMSPIRQPLNENKGALLLVSEFSGELFIRELPFGTRMPPFVYSHSIRIYNMRSL